MKFNSLRPILWTKDTEETILFYKEILQFKIENQNKEWDWTILSKDDIEIMIAKPNEHIHFSKPGFTGSFYFNVDDVDSLWENIKEKVTICYEIETFEWEMREFAIYDNNGYILQFGQDIVK